MSDDPSRLSPIDRDAYTWMIRFASGKATPTDLAALKQWSAQNPANALAFDKVSRTWNALGPLGRDMLSQGLLDGRHETKVPDLLPARATIRRRAFLSGALAASAAGIATAAVRPPLGLWPSWSELAADYRTQTGEQRRIILTDDMSIEMNTQTSIAVRSGDNGTGRIELISGEAIISASSKSADEFTVLAADGRVTANNARFNMRHQDQAVCVTCLAGAIRVERATTLSRLTAGQQVVYSREGLGSAMTIDPKIVSAWQDGMVIFQSTPVTEVVVEVNRYRSGKIFLTSDALGRRLFNARLRIANIDRIVGQIEQAFGAKSTRLPGGLVLLG